MNITIDFRTLTEEQREDFVQIWADNNFYMDDVQAACLWCAPWDHSNSIFTLDLPENYTLQDLVLSYYASCEDEIEQLLEQEIYESL